MIDCILLDMDGVMANFVSRSLLVCDIPLIHDHVDRWSYFEPYMDVSEFWRRIESDPHFWLSLKPYDWGRELYDTLEGVAPVTFCSTPSNDSRSAEQKIEWLREYGFMGRDENRYFLVGIAPSSDGHRLGKNMLAGPRRVLIDDSDANVKDFIASGGHGILFPQPWNEARQHTGDRLGHVKRELQEIIRRVHEEEQIAEIVKVFHKTEERVVEAALQDCNVAENQEHAETPKVFRRHLTESQRALVSGRTVKQSSKSPENPKDAIGATKIPLSVVPSSVLMEVAMGMFDGAWKYQSYNYREIPIRYSRYYDAAMRHLMAWWEGEDIDPDSGLNHIAKVLSCLTVLRDAMLQSENGGKPTIDDRPPKSKVPMSYLQKMFDTVRARLETQHGPMKPPYTEVG